MFNLTSMIRAISNVTSTTGDLVKTGLEMTNSTLSELNKSLESISQKIEIKNDLYKIAKLVYEEKKTKARALSEIKNTLGDKYYSEFEEQLDKFRDMDYELYSYKMFPPDSNEKSISKKYATDLLKTKYGNINEKEFNFYINQRRRWIVQFLSNNVYDITLNNLTDEELYDKFKEADKDVKEFLNRCK